MQNEVSVVTADEAVGADTAKTPLALRRRKRTCSRRQGEKEKERESGGLGTGERGDRGVGEDRDRREASKSDSTKLKWFELEFQFLPPIVCAMLPTIGYNWTYITEAGTEVKKCRAKAFPTKRSATNSLTAVS